MDRWRMDQRGRSVRVTRITAIAVLCLLLSLLLVFGISRQLGRDDEVAVLGKLASNPTPRAAAGEGFETWVLVQNPGDRAVHVNLALNTGEGEKVIPELQDVEIAAGGRRSIPLHAYVHTYHVSTRVEATDGEVVCERAMYWNGRAGGHDSVGVTSPAPVWYLAEGATAGEFETW
ncbi:MAG: hypothetical protein AB1384_09000, partial [Actinomycetota bacterium]